MKTINSFICLFAIFVLTLNSVFSQETKDRNFRLEIEPSSFAMRGVSGSIMYNITQDNKFSLGLYSASLDVPVWSREDMFDNVGEDTSDVRLGFEIALTARYRFDLFPEWESEPYVGLIAGWEYFDVTQPSFAESVRLSTFLITPYVGYEFYFFRQMLFINPQLRSVLYVGASSSDETRPEKMGTFFLLPQISLGVRF